VTCSVQNARAYHGWSSSRDDERASPGSASAELETLAIASAARASDARIPSEDAEEEEAARATAAVRAGGGARTPGTPRLGRYPAGGDLANGARVECA
jgi:hypothetical protein